MGLNAEQIVAALERDSENRIPVMDRLELDADTIDLVNALTQADRPIVRQLICDLLGRIRDPLALDGLLDAMDDGELRVRAAAADAIGKIFGYVDSPPVARRSDALTVLLRRWHDEPSVDVRSTLAQTLALVGDPSVRPVLLEALEDQDSRVRAQARWGLSYLEEMQQGNAS